MILRPTWICAALSIVVLVCGCGAMAPAPITVAITPQFSAIATGQTAHFTGLVENDTTGVTWSATTGTIDADGDYDAPTTSQSTMATVTATSKKDPTRSATAVIHIVTPGQVSATANPQVALYSIAPGAPANVLVQFGPDTNYALKTWTQPAPQTGGPVNIFVAGMTANSTYHIRGVVEFSDGAQFVDAGQNFLTGSLSSVQLPTITATTTPGMTPQSGVELLDLWPATFPPLGGPTTVTDLTGNVLWTYSPNLPGVGGAFPIKLLPNGHFLLNYSNGFSDGINSVLREVDLSGGLVWQMTAADLNAALAAATCMGCNITVVGTHHDFAVLPNGHLIVIAATQRTDVVPGTTVTGDVIIDLDENRKPVWLWNEFNYLDINRHPMGFPDWTHTNAVVYSPDDGNLIVSIRHQNWLVKIDYESGKGSGDVLWRLGYQGDFTLLGGTDPTDWFYAQHGPSFGTKNTTGNFALALFDNGNDRVFPSGVTCGTTGAPACLYSTAPIIRIDETAKTAKLAFNPAAPSYSFFGGNNAVLSNGNVEFCEAAGGPGVAGDIYEVTQGAAPQTVWHLRASGQYLYRGQRIPSLYPGVQW